MDDDSTEEGWFTDPFGRHEARWLSNGLPTRLVRDGGAEAYDEPPHELPTHVPERIDGAWAGASDGRQRADDAEAGQAYDRHAARQAAFDSLDRSV